MKLKYLGLLAALLLVGCGERQQQRKPSSSEYEYLVCDRKVRMKAISIASHNTRWRGDSPREYTSSFWYIQKPGELCFATRDKDIAYAG